MLNNGWFEGTVLERRVTTMVGGEPRFTVELPPGVYDRVPVTIFSVEYLFGSASAEYSKGVWKFGGISRVGCSRADGRSRYPSEAATRELARWIVSEAAVSVPDPHDPSRFGSAVDRLNGAFDGIESQIEAASIANDWANKTLVIEERILSGELTVLPFCDRNLRFEWARSLGCEWWGKPFAYSYIQSVVLDPDSSVVALGLTGSNTADAFVPMELCRPDAAATIREKCSHLRACAPSRERQAVEGRTALAGPRLASAEGRWAVYSSISGGFNFSFRPDDRNDGNLQVNGVDYRLLRYSIEKRNGAWGRVSSTVERPGIHTRDPLTDAASSKLFRAVCSTADQILGDDPQANEFAERFGSWRSVVVEDIDKRRRGLKALQATMAITNAVVAGTAMVEQYYGVRFSWRDPQDWPQDPLRDMIVTCLVRNPEGELLGVGVYKQRDTTGIPWFVPTDQIHGRTLRHLRHPEMV